MAPEPQPRIRLASIPDDALLVVRGHPSDIETDARRFLRRFHEWGRYGVSGFLAIDLEGAVALGADRLERFDWLFAYRHADLVAAHLEVVPTFRRPHVTIAHADLGALVTGLMACEHVEIDNRTGEEGERGDPS